jgi:diguanylate cyclase (GGDEF)-like protein/PAS domain S-box-containing protein
MVDVETATEAGALADMGRDVSALVPDLVCLCRNGLIADINPAGVALVQAPDRKALVGRPLADLVHPDYAVVLEDGLAALVAEPGGIPLMLRTLRGERREVQLQGRAVGDDGQVMIYARNVTERTRAVEGLLASEARFRQLVDRALSMICLVRAGRVTYVNAAGLAMMRAPSAAALVGAPVADLLHADYTAIVELGLEALALEGDLLPLRLTACDGHVLDVEARLVALEAGTDSTIMMEVRDITERMRAAQALREREQRLQGILDSVSEAVVTTDDQGLIQSFNPAARDLFGYTAAEVIGRNVSILMPERFAREHDRHMAQLRRDGARMRMLGLTRELEARRKDGSVVPIEIAVSRLRLAQGTLITGILRDITERRRREEAERRYKEDLELQVEERTRQVRHLGRQTELILKSAGDGIVGFDAIGHVIFANPVAERLLGATPDGLRGRSLDDIFRTAETRQPPDAVSAIVGGQGLDAGGEIHLLALDESALSAEYAAAPIHDDGRRLGAVVVFRDISARKEAERRLRLAYTVFDTASEAIVVCDAEAVINMVNPAFTEITGHAEAEALGRSALPLLFDSPARLRTMLDTVVSGVGEWTAEFWHRRRDGAQVALRISASAVRDEDDRDAAVGSLALVVSDVTRRKRDEEQIRHQANHDALTGLANRALFMETLARTVADARGGGGAALMFIDLDGFKAVNDTLGHDAGDLLLKGAAKRIRRAAREDDTVARLGGDEFTVILPGVLTEETAMAVADRILSAIGAPYSLDGQLARVSASIGLAVLCQHDSDAEMLLRRADAAMYMAKQGGKAAISVAPPPLPDPPPRPVVTAP